MGRAAELARLDELFGSRQHRGAVLAGPPGVGKTWLAKGFVELATKAGLECMWATASTSGSGVPFGALAPLLPVAEHSESGVVDSRADLLRRFTSALVDRAQGRGIALVVDDAHLLDQASAMLLYQLVATNRAFVLVTVRTGEPAPEPIVGLWKDGWADRIELAGLTLDDVEEVLIAVLGGHIDRAAAAYIAEHSEGNALFMRELVISALEDGTLVEDSGVWQVVGKTAPSRRLVELIGARLQTLSRAEYHLLEVLAYGEPLGIAEIAALCDESLLEALERRQLVTSQLDGRRLQFRLAHPLYGDVLRSTTPGFRLRKIARGLADVVEGKGARRREDALRVATWRLDGGGPHDPDVMLAAALTARWRYDFPLAERLARASLQAGGGFDADLLVGHLARLQGRTEEAEEQFALLAPQAGDDAQRAAVAISRIDNLMFVLGRGSAALQLAEDAAGTIDEVGWRDQVAARRAGVLMATRGPRAAADAAAPLVERATGRALVWASMVASYELGRLGRVKPALEAASRGYQAQIALGEPLEWYPWYFLWVRCEVLARAGDFAAAEELATSQYQQGLADGSPEARAYFAFHLAKWVGERGHLATALPLAAEATALFRQLGQPAFVRNALVPRALALALGGQAEAARAALREIENLETDPALWSGLELGEAQAWTAVAEGEPVLAKHLLSETAALGEKIGDLVAAASALHGLARLGDAHRVSARITSLCSGVQDSPLLTARVAHSVALSDHDPEALTDAADRFESFGAVLLAGEASADAATQWRRIGEPGRATAAAIRSAKLASRCGGARTPGLAAVGTPVALTPAERETALLAAAGSSNKEIAEALVLSVRTVENRLQRIYEKLQIRSRAELALIFNA